MGLLKAGIGALSGVLADQWREYFYCDSMPADVLMTKGQKRVNSARSSNTKGSDNIITKGSIIAVNDGQCMLIVDQGKVAEICAEPGEFVYDSSTEPSIFYGGLGKGILETFKAIGRRFTFGGDTGKDQRVYYINIKEIMGNKYGTPNPVAFRVVDKNVGLDLDIDIKCFGEYSFRIVDPILFYTNVCANVTSTFRRGDIESQLKSELLTALSPAFARISELGIRYSALMGHTTQIADALNEELSQKWAHTRGIAIAAFGVSSVSADPEQEAQIRKIQMAAAYRDPTMGAAALVGAQAEAMTAAANNPNAGPVMAFAGMNMANQAGGMNAQNLYQMGQQNAQAAAAAATAAAKPAADSWTCECGAVNTGKFCTECGKPKPEVYGWTCECGTFNQGKFCTECGKPKPKGAKTYRCDKCGWEPEDKSTPPKFCPQCGDPFDNEDEVTE